MALFVAYRLENGWKVRQKCDKFRKNLFCATVCAPVLYALPYIIRLYNGRLSPLLWAGSVAFRYAPTYSPTYGGAVSNTDPIHKGMNQIHSPTQKSVSIDTSGKGVNLTAPICVIGSKLSGFRCPQNRGYSNYAPCPVCLIALSLNRDARRLPGWVNPLLDAPTCEDVPTFGDVSSQIPPDVAALHRLRFWVRGNAVQMRGKQAFGVWQYTFITGQRKSAEPAKTRLCAVLYAV